MIGIKNGIDIMHINRIQKAVERLGRPFHERIWTAAELSACLADVFPYSDQTFASLSVRFAAKEAVAKALGTGIGGKRVSWTEISVYSSADGQPQIMLTGAAQQCFSAMGGFSISISLTHEGGIALAQCVLLYRETSK